MLWCCGVHDVAKLVWCACGGGVASLAEQLHQPHHPEETEEAHRDHVVARLHTHKTCITSLLGFLK